MGGFMNGRILLACIAILTASCSGSDYTQPVDAAGNYTGQVTNGLSSCPGVWVTGAMADVQITVAQTGQNVSLRAEGGGALILQAEFGTTSFNGSINGSHVDALIIGSRMAMSGACVYTMNGQLSADLNGNTMTGSITYTPQTNNNADCT